MTTTYFLSSILFLLATFLSHSRTETNWSTESDAEEEEEKRPNVLLGNDSLGSTFIPEDSPSTRPTLVDKLVALDGNALWNRPMNISDYDELHEESKHDASPENSVDKDSLDNVNYFLPENPVTESSIQIEGPDRPFLVESSNHMEIKELAPSIESSIHLSVNQPPSSTPSKLFLLSNDTASAVIAAASSQDATASLTSLKCEMGDPKCKPPQLSNTEELESKFNEKFATTMAPISSLWNIFKSLRSEDTSDSSDIIMEATTPPNDFTSSITPSENPFVLTSENIILIDGIDAEKDESVIQIQSNKSEKSKQIKNDDSVEELSDEQIFLKTTTTPVVPLVKETILSDFPSLMVSPLFTKLTEISSTPSLNVFSSDVLFPVTSTESELSKTSSPVSYDIPISYYDDKEAEIPGDYAKVSKELSDISTSLFSPVSENHAKNIPAGKDKPTKIVIETSPEATQLLSPSFENSRTSIEIAPIESIRSSFLEPSENSFYVTQISSSDLTTPILETAISSQYPAKEVTTTILPRDDDIPPPRLTNPSCTSLPVCVEITLLDTTWEKFCSQSYDFREFLSKSVSHYTRPVFPHHIVLDTEVCARNSLTRPLQTSPDITVAFYVTNDSGEYEERLTEICGVILRKWAPTAFRTSIIEVRLYNSEIQSTPLPLLPELNSGFVAAVSISAVAGVALCLLCILLVIMKQKLLQGRNSETATPTADAYSLDSLSINASFRRRRNRRSARSYLNHAFNDQEIPSHPLNEKTLANCLKSRDLLEEEFKKIPLNMPKLDSIPEGAHVKNRYSNILPRPESRVVLAEPSGDPLKCYINANFVKGYEGKSEFYIACQAPLPEGIEDFWRMVWEQQCRVIIMLTMFEENGTVSISYKVFNIEILPGRFLKEN
ncbi:tyrosine-protein phosphatase non-receptor type 7 [Caerostris darwini]|uniref:protein-tyrosine-phosphatase n=1 Tax=Caerostris darwini TaxID=1538125 RepID=A0AAV4TVU1_9ARAC|nr:tyrosine-protein phosphatase non-receptor type 7 [Caerostris darwini]